MNKFGFEHDPYWYSKMLNGRKYEDNFDYGSYKLDPYLSCSQKAPTAEEKKLTLDDIKKSYEAVKAADITTTINSASKVIESAIPKEITNGISEEVIAYGLVHALSKQAEAIVGESELPLIKMTPSMLQRLSDHLYGQLEEIKKKDWTNREGKRKRLVAYYEALIGLTER